MALHNVKTVLAVIALFAAGACAGVVTKGYTGATLPADQTALIGSGPYTSIEKCDGLTVVGLGVTVLPGKHTVEMKPNGYPYREYLFYSWTTGSVEFTADAGRKYVAYVDFIPAPETDGQFSSGYTWIGYIQDVATGKKIAQTDRLPLGVERRGFPFGSQDIRHQ